jgi:predicted alpha/beta superfamily hydrolase
VNAIKAAATKIYNFPHWRCYLNMNKYLICSLFSLWALSVSALQPYSATTNSPKTIADPPVVQFGTKGKLHSKILDEDRPYLVCLPPGYRAEGKVKYPVLYILDGEAHFEWASSMVRFLSAGPGFNQQIPEMIVVAIPNTGNNRVRDFTPTHALRDIEGKENMKLSPSGGGRAFEEFLTEELIPQIESDYRSAPFRVFAGHSLGGLLAIDIFLQRPGLFQGCIAMDPAFYWDDERLLRDAREIFENKKPLPGSLYISSANNFTPHNSMGDAMRRTCRNFTELLRTNGPANLRTKSDYYESDDHSSVTFPTLYHGLLFAFDDYHVRLTEAVENPTILANHFRRASARFGYEILPPEGFVNWIGYYQLREKDDLDKAMEYFKLNVSNYPASANTWDSLAEGWMRKGDSKLAIQNYEKALALSPNLRTAKEALKKLQASK